jgi:hypothetical protein
MAKRDAALIVVSKINDFFVAVDRELEHFSLTRYNLIESFFP